jgi:hypothetical protein
VSSQLEELPFELSSKRMNSTLICERGPNTRTYTHYLFNFYRNYGVLVISRNCGTVHGPGDSRISLRGSRSSVPYNESKRVQF